MRHELAGLFIDITAVNQNFTNFLVKIITNCPDDQAAFLVNQENTTLVIGRFFNGKPELRQII